MVGVSTVIIVALSHRLVSFYHPATLSGQDPDKIAAAVNRIIHTGKLSSIEGLNFYSGAPLYFLNSVGISHFMGLEAQYSAVAYVLIVTIITPLAVAVLVQSLSWLPDSAVTIAASISVVSTASSIDSLWPIPQQHAVVLFFITCVLLLIYHRFDANDKTIPILLILSLASIVASHKIGGLYTLAALLGVLVIGLVNEKEYISKYRMRKHQSQNTAPLLILTILSTIFLLIVWTYTTTQIRPVATLFLQTIIHNPGPVSGAVLDSTAAEPTTSGISGIIIRQGHWLIYLPFVSIGWVILWRMDKSPVLAGIAAAVGSLFIITFIGAVSTRRMLLFAEPIFSILLVVLVFAGIFSARKGTTTGSILLLFVIIFAQISAPLATLDHPQESRQYLTHGEWEGKKFVADHTSGEVYADYYYARQNVEYFGEGVSYRPGGADPTPDGFSQLGPDILAGDTHEQGYPNVLIRTNVDTVMFGGHWNLEWNPSQEFDNSTDYSKVVDNGEVSLYHKSNDSSARIRNGL
ncbi:hypothetical protein [Natronobiforma cellulositropha]|uniref:hypothetical protein n=1 Tax=Natronobiforma cellulositropha TaxID=1679076 RepID=UPI0021D6042E|nr:hypothetical protein [Natronobiforma cellulositropha]